MSRITVDESLTAQLSGANDRVLLCDVSGKILGVFTPSGSRSKEEDSRLEPQVSDDELERRERETTVWYTTAEVLAKLESL